MREAGQTKISGVEDEDMEELNREGSLERLQELVDIKSAFLWMTLHELRRPLAEGQARLAMIRDGAFGSLPRALEELLSHVAAAHEEMSTLVDGLATAARIEERDDALRLTICRLAKVVAEAVASVEMEAAAKRVRVECPWPAPDLEARADLQGLRVAICNLLSNAIKFAPPETVVTVTVGRNPSGESIIAVSDQGPGVDPAEAESVFERWSRSRFSSAGGFGLGLYIVQRIVDLHGGHVVVEKGSRGGATFTIVLPPELESKRGQSGEPSPLSGGKWDGGPMGIFP
jgi:signal transduction histidine kinase